jgi:hypothetical protein
MTQEIQDKLEAAKAPFVASMEAIDAIPALVEVAEQLKFEEGFKKGQDSMVLPSVPDGTGKYSQEDMDKLAEVVRGENDEEVAKLTGVIGEKDAKIVELEEKLAAKDAELGEVEGLKAQVEALRAAIQVEIDDSKVDTARLEAVVSPMFR